MGFFPRSFLCHRLIFSDRRELVKHRLIVPPGRKPGWLRLSCSTSDLGTVARQQQRTAYFDDSAQHRLEHAAHSILERQHAACRSSRVLLLLYAVSCCCNMLCAVVVVHSMLPNTTVYSIFYCSAQHSTAAAHSILQQQQQLLQQLTAADHSSLQQTAQQTTAAIGCNRISSAKRGPRVIIIA